MENNSTYLSIMVVITLLSLAIVLPQLLREYPLGCDGYYYLTYAGVPQPGMPPAMFYLLAAVPPILVSLAATFCILILVYRIAKQCNAPPLITTLLALAAPMLLLRMAMLEDDIIGFPIALLGVLSYMKARNDLERIAILALFGGYGVIAWRPMWLFAAMIVFHEAVTRYKSVWLSLPVWALMLKPFPNAAHVGENQLGFIFMPSVFLGVIFGAMELGRRNDLIHTWAVFFLACGVVQAKWLWLAIIPLALMLADYLRDAPKQKITAILIFFVGLGYAYGFMMVLSAQPTSQQMDDLKEVVAIANGSEINNEWWVGHWLAYLGGNPRYTNLHPTEERYVPGDAEYHLTNVTLDSPKIKEFGWLTLYSEATTP